MTHSEVTANCKASSMTRLSSAKRCEITATLARAAAHVSSSWLHRVVFPDPKDPAMMVTGTGEDGEAMARSSESSHLERSFGALSCAAESLEF